MCIFKETNQGKKLKSMIDSNLSLEVIMDYVDTVFLKNISITTARKLITSWSDECFNNGIDFNQSKIRSLLGISQR